ncbi:hypothetical protein VTO42DRAFT_1712 [Malbranchea cinnamomea]
MGNKFPADSKYAIGAHRTWSEPAVKGESSGASSQHVEQAQLAPRPGLFRRLWRHFKRYWCLYGIGGVIFLAIFLPVFFLVAFPAIAQRMVDDADLPIHSAMIMNPTPDSVDYSLVASISVPKPFTVRIDPITLHLYRDSSSPDNPYISVDLPEYRLKGNTVIEIANQTVKIRNHDEFKAFLKESVYQEKFILAAKGSTTAHLGALKADITLDKKLEEYGLNMIKGYDILSARILIPPGKDGALMAGLLQIPNASKVTFAMGNVTLNVMVSGVHLGLAELKDVVLSPGNNTVEARIFPNLNAALQNIGTILESQKEPLTRGNVLLSASGNQTIFNGEHIEYFEYVLNNLVMSAEVPIMKLLTDTLGGLVGAGGGLLGDILSNVNLTEIMGILENLNLTGLADFPQLGAVIPEIPNLLEGLGEFAQSF